MSGCAATADIAFLMDGSRDVGRSNFELQKIFVKSIARRYHISTHHSHIGVSTYGATTRQEIKFTDSRDFASVNSKINNIRYPNSYGRNLASAVRAANWQFFTKSPSYVHKALVIIVGGRQSSRNYRLLRRYATKLRRAKVYVHVVTVGKARSRYTSLLARRKHMMRVQSFKSLIYKARALGRQICEEMVRKHYNPGKLNIMTWIFNSSTYYIQQFLDTCLRKSGFTRSEIYKGRGYLVWISCLVKILGGRVWRSC